MLFLKQSTAVTLKIGPFVDEDDGKTAETGLTISQADVRLSKNGGNMAQKNDATSCTHDEIGVYDCPLDATDTGTLGRLQVFVHESGALPVWQEFMVIPANEYDSLISGTDALEVDANQITATVEGTFDVVEALRLCLAALCGKSSGGGTANVKYRDTGDSKDRVDATVDANGNRTAVTLDES